MGRSLRDRSDVEIVGVAAWHRYAASAPWEPPMEVRHLLLPRRALYELWHRIRAPKVQRVTGHIDVLHATTMAIPPKSAPMVVTVHDLAFLHYPEMSTAHGLSFFHRGLALAVRDADLVLCPSEATMRDCEAHGFSPDALRLVPLGIESHSVDDREIERTRATYGLGRPYILWTGTVEPRKNLKGLIAAFRSVATDFDLALAGPHGWKEDLGALAGDARDRIKVLGFVPDADLWALYAGAEVFCYPSLMEGFGFPVLEAMAQGTPVVTAAGSSTGELAGDAAVLVEARDPESIAEGINRVLADRDLARRLSAAGRGRAEEFTWDRTAELVRAAYAEVAL